MPIRSAHRLTLALLLVTLVLAFSFTNPSAAHAVGVARYVIHISVDGLNSQVLQSVIDAGDAPTFKRLESEAAWTTNARTDYTHTITLPNHTSMITGRPVLQPDGMPDTVNHGWTFNDNAPRGAILHTSGNPHVGYIASVFDVVHDAGLTTAMFVTKDKFVVYHQSYNETNGAPNAHGRDKIDTYFFQDDGPPMYSEGMNHQLLADLAARHFNYTFVHYRDTDSAGHAFGWGSQTYYHAIENVDGYLADLLRLVETDPELKGRTTVIISADHGGFGTNHSDAGLVEDYTIPMFVWGAGVGRGDLYAMNGDTRTNPVAARPDYSSAGQPIRNGDTGNLALHLLGLGLIPGSMINAKQDLRVALAGDYNLDGTVDAADYTLWQDTLGSKTDLRADGNGDGVVDQADGDLWKSTVVHSPAAAQ